MQTDIQGSDVVKHKAVIKPSSKALHHEAVFEF